MLIKLNKSILAGMLIGIGATVYLKAGGAAGALLFSVGLLAILHFDLNLFTGKAGLLATKGVSWKDLGIIYVGNLLGVSLICAFAAVDSSTIVATREANSILVNFAYGVFCGLLMYIAVTSYKETKNVAFVLMPVGAFILAGFNHCIADMFYCLKGSGAFLSLIPTTIGNLVGCNLIPLLLNPINRPNAL